MTRWKSFERVFGNSGSFMHRSARALSDSLRRERPSRVPAGPSRDQRDALAPSPLGASWLSQGPGFFVRDLSSLRRLPRPGPAAPAPGLSPAFR